MCSGRFFYLNVGIFHHIFTDMFCVLTKAKITSLVRE